MDSVNSTGHFTDKQWWNINAYIFIEKQKRKRDFYDKTKLFVARTAIMSNSDESNIIKKSFQKTFINSLFELEAKNIASEKRGNKCLGKDDVRDKEPLTLSNVSTENCVAVCLEQLLSRFFIKSRRELERLEEVKMDLE